MSQSPTAANRSKSLGPSNRRILVPDAPHEYENHTRDVHSLGLTATQSLHNFSRDAHT